LTRDDDNAMQPLKLVGLTDEPVVITTSPEDVPNEPPA
jgi:hypothetical protein